MRFVPDLPYQDGENHLFDLYLPEKESFDLLIWIHGGGLERFDRKTACFAEDLTNAGLAVASVEYRMYPTAKFPDFIVDCANAVKYITDNIAQYGNVGRVFLSGQSAGAYITLMLCFDEHYLRDAGVDRHRITAYISDSAQTTSHFRVLQERGVDGRLQRIDDAAVMYHLSPDSDFQHLLLIYYTSDLPCRPEQNRLFYKSILRLFPDRHVDIVELCGDHCHGSNIRNADGEYDFNVQLLRFIDSIS